MEVSDRVGVPKELASTLRHLNLEEVERRRKLLSNNTRYKVPIGIVGKFLYKFYATLNTECIKNVKLGNDLGT